MNIPERELDPCSVCNTDGAESKTPMSSNGIRQLCIRCGEFEANGDALNLLSTGLGPDKRAKISGWVREQFRAGVVPVILTGNRIKQILSLPLPTIMERAELLLLEAVKGQDKLGEIFNITDPRFLAASYSTEYDDVHFLQTVLRGKDMLQTIATGGSAEVMPDGYIHADNISRKQVNSSQAFVAMWFDENLIKAYENGFATGIINAGYDPLRIDKVEHINRIDDEIIAQIKVSRFVVADFTGHRTGVYFEAGYGMGLDLPVIWTCHKDSMDDLHFDIRQFNCIDWEEPSDLAERLQKRIEAVIGVGPKKILDSP